MKINAIIFDFGGVLLEWNPRNLYCRYFPDQPEAMERFLNEINFSEWNLQQDKGRPFAQAEKELSAQFPQYDQLIKAYFVHYEESLTGSISGTADLLYKLKRIGYPLYGLSNWSGETFPIARRKYKFFDLFDDIIISGDVKMIKPDPAIFYLALQRFGKSANECVYIDDSLPNVVQAQKMEFITIHFQSPAQLESELRKLRVI